MRGDIADPNQPPPQDSGPSCEGADLVTAAIPHMQIPSNVDLLSTLGYFSKGDGWGAIFVRTTADAALGKLRSADGAWWILSRDQVIRPELFGGASAAEINAALKFSRRVSLTAGRNYRISSPIVANPGNELDAKGAVVIAREDFAGNFMLAAADGFKLLGGYFYGGGLRPPNGP